MASRDDVRVVRELLVQEAFIVDVPRSVHVRVTGDPEDDHVLAATVLGGAQYLVTGDKLLLKMDMHRGVRIVNARMFLNLLRDEMKEGGEKAA